MSLPCHKGRSQQSGQAIVLVLLLAVIGVISTIALVSTGMLTSEKMQMQNAADATAYSVSVLEARDLNYGAYMNRAMVANEVAIGQMVSSASWSKLRKDEVTNLKLIGAALNGIPYIGQALSGALNGYASVINFTATGASKVVDPLSKAISKGLHYLDSAYGYSQTAMRFATFVFTSSAVANVPEQHFKNSSTQVELSPFGWFALGLHYSGYYGDLVNYPFYNFVKHPSGTDSDMGRFAQVVNDSRDSFTKNRGCTITPDSYLANAFSEVQKALDLVSDFLPGITLIGPSIKNCDADDGGWEMGMIEVQFRLAFEVDILLASFSIDAYFTIGLDTERTGGSQVLSKGKDSSKGYVWSAADGAGLGSEFTAGIEVCGEVLGVGDCWEEDAEFETPNVPFGTAIGYANTEPNLSNVPTGKSGRDATYGQLPNDILTWEMVKSPVPPTPSFNVLSSYKLAPGGYQKVNDIPGILEDGKYFSGMEAPFILIGLVGELDPNSALKTPTGNFALQDAATEIAVIGKAQVYYSQPLITESRPGGENGFNPYWGARLVDTSYLDRVAALTFQSGQLPLPGEVDDMLAALESLKEKLLGLLK